MARGENNEPKKTVEEQLNELSDKIDKINSFLQKSVENWENAEIEIKKAFPKSKIYLIPEGKWFDKEYK